MREDLAISRAVCRRIVANMDHCARPSRFGSFSKENIQEKIEGIMPVNTKKNRKSIWDQFIRFCNDKCYELSASTTPTQLGQIMMDWGFNMRKMNGEDYKESVVKTVLQLPQKMYFKTALLMCKILIAIEE